VRLLELCGDDVTAVPSLREPGAVPGCLSDVQEASGLVQVAPLAMDVGHPDVSVDDAAQAVHRGRVVVPQRWVEMSLRRESAGDEVQCLDVLGQSVVQAALRLADVGQNDGTAEDIGEESCSLEVGLGSGVGVVAYAEITLCPRGETEER